jgi:hypothetical protein
MQIDKKITWMKRITTQPLWLFTLSILLLYSCHFRKNQDQFTSFPAEFVLEPTIIELDQHYVHARLHLFDSLIFITNTPGNPYQIHVYDANFQYIKSSGLVGAGPGEITNPFFAAVDHNNKSLWFLDMGKQVFFKFHIDSLMNSPVYFPGTFVPIPPEKFAITQYYPLNNNTFSYSDFHVSPPMISFMDMNGTLIDSILLNNLPEDFHHNQNREFINTFLYQHHPREDKIVLLHRHCDIMVIIDKESKVLATRQGPDMITQIPDATNQHQLSTYDALQVDDTFIYGLYRGTTVFDENFQLNYPRSIHVFRWDGEPAARLILEHPLTDFTLDTKNNRLIGFSLKSGDLVEYSLHDFYDKSR